MRTPGTAETEQTIFTVIPANEALALLQAGNKRFFSDTVEAHQHHASRRADLVNEQKPFAVILCCSDSRVPAETIFDQSLGDLFVIRVAGNIATQTQIGSVEFAVQKFNTRLIVVLGHSNCGAIIATLNALREPSDEHSPNLLAIVEQISPSVQSVLNGNKQQDDKQLIQSACRENVRTTINRLTAESTVLESLVDTDGLQIVGAEYSLETGIVDFFGM